MRFTSGAASGVSDLYQVADPLSSYLVQSIDWHGKMPAIGEDVLFYYLKFPPVLYGWCD